MKALTLWQPYGSLIAAGAKRFETRDWSPPMWIIGQTIAIHAAIRAPENPFELPPGAAKAIDRVVGNSWCTLPRGAVLCTARVAGIYWSLGMDGRTVVCERRCADRDVDTEIMLAPGEEHFGNYQAGRCLWELVEVRRLPAPVQARGQRKLWDWRQ